MLSSQGKPNNATVIEQQVLKATQTQWEQRGESEQIFHLIDSFLPFEACLYHQILPFGWENNNLLLGMVYPQDKEALDYIGRILSYINCTMISQAIAAETHRTILSAYLNHKNTSQLAADSQTHQPSALMVSPESLQNLPPSDPNNSSVNTAFLTPTNKEQESVTSELALSENLSTLPAQVPELFSPIELLPTLPPKQLLQELLGRILVGGIGRLYLERQPYEGRILWSNNGVLQSALDKLPLSVFQGVLNELKRFASLPITRVTEPKQVERECIYQKNRLLLRLRVMPGIHGEEATLQILRGAALKFYQQQQLTRVSRDALGIAQQLSFKLHELQERLLLNPNLDSQQLEALVTLNQLVQNLDQKIKILTK